MRALVHLCVGALVLSACTATGEEVEQPDATKGQESLPATSEPVSRTPSTTAGLAETSSTTAVLGETSTTTTPQATTEAPNEQGVRNCPSPTQGAEGPSVSAEIIMETGELTVRAARYPHPDYEGNPWSQWGKGVVTHDGRFLSAIGDHRGRDGNSYFYEFDPNTSRLTLVGDVLSVLEHREGDWGYGKIHGALIRDDCLIYAATYWGSRRNLEFGGTYDGDHLLRWDPSDHEIESLGVPVRRQGIPSLAGVDAANLVYGEALHPHDEGKTFFVFDLASQRIAFTSSDTGHVGFRDVMVGADGAAYFSAGDGRLMVYRPGGGGVEVHPHRLPGAWVRASTQPDGNGVVYGVTRNPERLFAMGRSGEIRDLGPAPGYVASIALDAERRRLYYVPHAHGGAWRDGAPIIAVDTSTGNQEILVELERAAENHLGLRLGGTYNTVYDASSRRLYVGMNAGPLAEDEESFGEVVLLIIDLP